MAGSSQKKENKEYNSLLKTNKKIKNSNTFKWYLAFALLLILYLTINAKCPYKTESECLEKFINVNMKLWFLRIFIISILYIYLLVSSLKTPIAKVKLLILALITFGFLAFCDKKVQITQYYGAVNFFIIFVVIVSLFFYSFFLIVRIVQRKLKFEYKFALFCLLCLYLIVQYIQIYRSCNNYNKGILAELEYTTSQCKIVVPKYCWYNYFDNVFDFNKINLFEGHFNKQESIKTLRAHYQANESVNYIGFPNNIKNFSQIKAKESNITIQQMLKNSSKYCKELSDCDKYDVTLDLSKPEYIINLQTTEEQKEKYLFNKKDKKLKNLVVIYIDALGRNRALSKIPKTEDFFRRQSNNTDLIVADYIKYLPVQFYTFDNLIAYQYGALLSEPNPNKKSKDSNVNVDENEKEYVFPFHNWNKTQNKPKDFNGTLQTKNETFTNLYKEINKYYITGGLVDSCQTTALIIPDEYKDIFDDAQFTHQAFPIGCDPNYYDAENPFSVYNGPFSIFRRYLYGKELHQYQFQFGRDFLKKYKNQYKALFLEFHVAHEGTAEVVKYIDDDLNEFLEFVKQETQLEDTMILLLSDHGFHMNGLFSVLNFGNVEIEKANPIMQIIADKSYFSQEELYNLKANQQKLTSIVDLRNLLLGKLVDPKYIQYGLSSEVEDDRNCDDIPLNTPCNCVN